MGKRKNNSKALKLKYKEQKGLCFYCKKAVYMRTKNNPNPNPNPDLDREITLCPVTRTFIWGSGHISESEYLRHPSGKIIKSGKLPKKKRKLLLATIDHRMPLSKGGDNNITNLVLACYECNQKKGNMMPGDFK